MRAVERRANAQQQPLPIPDPPAQSTQPSVPVTTDPSTTRKAAADINRERKRRLLEQSGCTPDNKSVYCKEITKMWDLDGEWEE